MKKWIAKICLAIMILLFLLCAIFFLGRNEITVASIVFAAIGFLCFSSNMYEEHTGFLIFLAVLATLISLYLGKEAVLIAVPFFILTFLRGIITGVNRNGFLKYIAILLAIVMVFLGLSTIAKNSPTGREVLKLINSEIGEIKEKLLSLYERTIALVGDSVIFEKGLNFADRYLSYIGLGLLILILFVGIFFVKENFIKKISGFFWSILGLGVTYLIYNILLKADHFDDSIRCCLGFLLIGFYWTFVADGLKRISVDKEDELQEEAE